MTAERSDRMAARNREIGQLLAQARELQQKSVSACAALLATSRRRYRAIERGEVGIEVAELELLLPYLELAPDVIFPVALVEAAPQRILRLRDGEILQVIFDAQGAPSPNAASAHDQ